MKVGKTYKLKELVEKEKELEVLEQGYIDKKADNLRIHFLCLEANGFYGESVVKITCIEELIKSRYEGGIICGVPIGKSKKIGEGKPVMFPWKLMERKELIKLIKEQQKEIERLEGELKKDEVIIMTEEEKEEILREEASGEFIFLLGIMFFVLLAVVMKVALG